MLAIHRAVPLALSVVVRMGLRLRVAVGVHPAHAIKRGHGIRQESGSRASRATTGGDRRDRARGIHRLDGHLANTGNVAGSRGRGRRVRARLVVIDTIC